MSLPDAPLPRHSTNARGGADEGRIARIGRARLKLTANPHDRNVPPSRLSISLQRVLVAFFLVALVAASVFLLMDRWRRGSMALSGALVYLGIIRWLVDSRILGVLAVRSRKFDSWFTIIIGVMIGFLALSVDPLI